MNKKNIMLVAGFVVVALVAFYAGTAYSKSKNVKTPQDKNQTGFGMPNSQFGQRGTRAGGGNVFGQIIAKDANSITVEIKAPTGPNSTTTSTGTGSKIVFFTDKTTVSKTTDGIIADLVVGKNITVQGTTNPDGSVNAVSFQIR